MFSQGTENQGMPDCRPTSLLNLLEQLWGWSQMIFKAPSNPYHSMIL